MNEIVTVIVPVYNAVSYLEKCIESIINQSYIYLEIILVDDGSTDGSGTMCDEYAEKDDRIKVIHQANRGASSARNAALDVSKGEYVSFVDADDYIDSKMIELLLRALVDNTADVSVCSFNYVYNSRNNNSISSPIKDEVLSGRELLLNHFFSHPSTQVFWSILKEFFSKKLGFRKD